MHKFMRMMMTLSSEYRMASVRKHFRVRVGTTRRREDVVCLLAALHQSPCSVSCSSSVFVFVRLPSFCYKILKGRRKLSSR